MDPLLLYMEVHRETRRRLQFLTAAKSMKRTFVGFFSRIMDCSKPKLPSLSGWNLTTRSSPCRSCC
jgi:hypothetical protein